MDQDKNNKENDDLIESNDAEATEAHANEPSDESPKEPQVIIKKSSNKLALFLSVLALMVPAYLLFIEYLSGQETLDTEVFDNQIQQLGEDNQKLRDQLQAVTTKYDNELTELKNQMVQLSQQPRTEQVALPFDNSKNEAALNTLEQQLNQQLSNHTAELTQLKQNLAQTAPSNQLVLPAADDQYDTKRTIDALYAADLLLRTQRLPQAISTLQQLLASAKLRTQTQQQINHLVSQWQKVQQPDHNALFTQLQSLKQQINQLTLNTEKANQEEGSWYSSFISVKKIESEGTLADSHSLHLLKAQLTQHVLQAEWALTLQQGPAWNQQLNAAKQLTKQKLPKEKALFNSFQNLANQQIVALLPTPSGIHDLISELKGQR